MAIFKMLPLIFVSSTLLFPSASNASDTNLAAYINTFDANNGNRLQDDWVVTETSSGGWFNIARKRGEIAKWMIKIDPDASSGNRVLTIDRLNSPRTNIFNIVYSDKVELLNGDISIKVRADSGRIDQGGGPIWRVKDKNNYYVARYNPLEKNFRVYYVKDADRIQLDSAEVAGVHTGEWFTIKIRHINDHIEGWLNGIKLLDVYDNTHALTGGVGLWTKADALSAFDDLGVYPK